MSLPVWGNINKVLRLPVLHLITLLQYIYRGKYRQTFINITQFYLFLYIKKCQNLFDYTLCPWSTRQPSLGRAIRGR